MLRGPLFWDRCIYLINLRFRQHIRWLLKKAESRTLGHEYMSHLSLVLSWLSKPRPDKLLNLRLYNGNQGCFPRAPWKLCWQNLRPAVGLFFNQQCGYICFSTLSLTWWLILEFYFLFSSGFWIFFSGNDSEICALVGLRNLKYLPLFLHPFTVQGNLSSWDKEVCSPVSTLRVLVKWRSTKWQFLKLELTYIHCCCCCC